VLDPDQLAHIVLAETLRILNAERVFLFQTETGGPGAQTGAPSPLLPWLGRDAAGTELTELTG
jgi:hypothetical protein